MKYKVISLVIIVVILFGLFILTSNKSEEVSVDQIEENQ